MKTKKTLAILLAVMMILSAVPMVASAAPIALTENNVTIHPQVTKAITYGQKDSDVEFSDGEVRYDSNGDGTLSDDEIVPGTWTYATPDNIPISSGAGRLKLTFTPEDTETYSGFTTRGRNTQYTIAKSDLVLVDEENDPPAVSGAVLGGTPLSEIEITGGEVVNKISSEAGANRSTGLWKWQDSTTIVNESGYYTAVRSGYSFNELTYSVYIEVGGIDTTVYGEVTAWPEIECPEWTKGMTVADLSLKGGEATVEGTFTITNVATTTLKPNTTTVITVVFTPVDSEIEMTTATTKTYQVTPTFTVKDIVIESITPITIEYGTMLKSMGGTASYYGVKTDVADAKLSFNLQENKDAGVYDVALAPGEYTVKAYVNVPTEWITGIGGVNFYNPTTIDVPIIVTKKQSTAKFGSVGSQENVQEDGSVLMNINYRFSAEDGKFGYAVLKVNGETVVDNITETAGTAYYGYNVRESGTYTATLEYVPAENDYIEYAETVQTKTVDITVELKEEEPIIPIIPGGDDEGDENENPDFDLDLDFDGSHKFDFVNLIQNLIAKLKAFIQQIGDFFSNMSLEGLGNIMG